MNSTLIREMTHQRIHSVVVIVAAVLSLSGCSDNTQTRAPASPQTKSISQPHISRFAGLEFAVPPGWSRNEASGGLLLLAPQIEDNWQANIFLEARLDREMRSLEQAFIDLVPNLTARKTQFVELGRKTDRLPGGFECGILEYSCAQQGAALREWQVIVVLPGGKRLFILASSPASRWDKYRPLFKSMLDSFK
jgi:hypothetical protein